MSPHFRRPTLRPTAGLALLSVALTGFAASPATPPVTLAAVLQRVEQQNPTLRAEGFTERSAEALIAQAALRPNPTFGFTAENLLGTGAAQGVRGMEATAQASQTFERGGKREKRIALAESALATASLTFALRRAELLAAAAEAYVETLAAQERLALAQEPLDLARKTLALIESNIRDGAASQAQAARARAATAAASVEHLRAKADLDQAQAALAATWGGESGEGIAVAGHLRLPMAPPTEIGALAHHPLLALQDAAVARSEAALSLEEAESIQDVTASGGLRFLSESSDAAFVAGVSIPIPVRNRNQGSIRAARESVAGAEQLRRATEAGLRAAASAAWRNLKAAHSAASALRREALPPTEEVAALVQRAHEAGESPLSEVLNAQRDLAALRREILDAELNYATSLIRYEALVNPTYSQSMALLSTP